MAASGTTDSSSGAISPPSPRSGCRLARSGRWRVQQLVDTRRTQPHRRSDLSHGKTLLMGRGNSDRTLPLGCVEPVGRDADTLPNPLLSLKAVARLVTGVHEPPGARQPWRCPEN
jgi:hypothetical protein